MIKKGIKREEKKGKTTLFPLPPPRPREEDLQGGERKRKDPVCGLQTIGEEQKEKRKGKKKKGSE